MVLVNFWATWCPPCVQEMPLMEALYQSLRQQPFVVWAVAMQENRDKVAPFMDKHRLSFRRIGAQQELSCHSSSFCRSDFSRDPGRLSRLKPLLHPSTSN